MGFYVTCPVYLTGNMDASRAAELADQLNAPGAPCPETHEVREMTRAQWREQVKERANANRAAAV